MEDHIIERPFYIVTLDDFVLGTTSEGIQIVHLKEFLLNE